jgi:V/A-type H+-transporting ATPase subunit D
MAELRRVPPGRAGKLWLVRRLRTGRLAADLLDRKLRILTDRQRELAELVERTGQQWRAAWQEADRWGRRGAVLGGRRELRLAALAEPARVEVDWADLMGLRYPAGARCTVPDPGPGDRGPGTAALVAAAAAYRAALPAAASHAAATAAAASVAAEIAGTRRRQRAIADRWVPTLESALRERAARLAEDELAERVRLRWAAGRPGRRQDRDIDGQAERRRPPSSTI